MATPNTGASAMKHALSQQGKTPSQSQAGAAATPPVSTPFSAAHAAFSPHGPRSSPQQVKKSPATGTGTSANLMAHPSNAAVNFDSPSAAAAFNALQIGSGLDLGLPGLDGLGTLGRSSDDDLIKKLDNIIAILKKGPGIVSEKGIERLATDLGLEVLWENEMAVDGAKKTLIVGGSLLELVVVFSSPDIVESATLGFPFSADFVNRHAREGSRILTDNLKLRPDQSPLNKTMAAFTKNFRRIAVLDQHSVHPGLNLHEAVAGIFESLSRLHTWEIQNLRQDPQYLQKSDDDLASVVLCTKSGSPAMNRRGMLGLTVDYWRENHLLPKSSDLGHAKWVEENEITWSILIGCAPIRQSDVALVNPVRVSDKWIGADIQKTPLPDDIHAGPMIDWLEPENTFITSDAPKPGPSTDALAAAAPLLGPRLPEVVFTATFDPPINIPFGLCDDLRRLGCGLPGVDVAPNYDTLIFPVPPGKPYDPSEPRVITHSRKVAVKLPGKSEMFSQSYQSSLLVYKPTYGRALSELTFSHPQQLINMLPYFRQYAFLSMVLEKSFKDKKPGPSTTTQSRETNSSPAAKTATGTTLDELSQFMEGLEALSNEPLKLDVTLTVHPIPSLQIAFPFRSGTATAVLEIRENGAVHVVSQDVIDEESTVEFRGKRPTVQNLGKLLEAMEDLAMWCEFIRTRWA